MATSADSDPQMQEALDLRRRMFREPPRDPGADDIFVEFDELTNRIMMMQLWMRSGLDLKTRSLCVLAAQTALNRPQVAGHVRSSLANGATKREIAEVLYTMAFYAGWGTCTNAIRIAREIFPEYPD